MLSAYAEIIVYSALENWVLWCKQFLMTNALIYYRTGFEIVTD
jgi:hypothetical protein